MRVHFLYNGPSTFSPSYIPVLPADRLFLLDIPTPFLMGCNAKHFHLIPRFSNPGQSVSQSVSQPVSQPVSGYACCEQSVSQSLTSDLYHA